MKRNIIPFFAVLTLVMACEKSPDMGQMDVSMTVYTDYDPATVFGDFETYFLPDSILDVGSLRAQYWSDDNSMKLVKTVEREMNSRGYVRITDPELKETADVGIQLSYVAETTTVMTAGYPTVWWNWGYWGPYWGGMYYPYPMSYSYSTNTFVMEMLDLEDKSKDALLPVIWRSVASGYEQSPRYSIPILQESIGQAFLQSDYITRLNK